MEVSENIKELKKQLQLYLESKIELYRLEAIDHSTYLFSFALGLMLVFIILLSFLISLGYFLGLWIGVLIESKLGGFGIISGIYLLILLVCYFRFKKLIQQPLQNLLIKKIDHYNEEKGK